MEYLTLWLHSICMNLVLICWLSSTMFSWGST